MFHNRLFKMLAVFVMLALLIVGIGYLLSNTATSAKAAEPTCSLFIVNTARLSASEVYYAQRFMPTETCSAQPVSQDVAQAQQAFSKMVASPGMSSSEVYYAQKASRFMTFATPEYIAGLPQ